MNLRTNRVLALTLKKSSAYEYQKRSCRFLLIQRIGIHNRFAYGVSYVFAQLMRSDKGYASGKGCGEIRQGVPM